MPLRVLSAVLAWGMASAPATQGRTAPSEVRVLLWADTPAVAAELPASIDSRFTRADADALVADLDRAREQAEDATRARLATVEAGLAGARDQYVAQEWDAMAAGLEQLEREQLAWLADPRHCEALWEIEFRRGLAARGLAEPDEARRRAAFALALAPDRRPARDIYGPEVVAEFAEAKDAQSTRVAAPVRIEVMPNDAVVHVDCQPVRGGHVDLRPGLHVVHARAMGHQSSAALFEVPAETKVELTLVADPATDAVDRLGHSLAVGPLVLALPSHRRALVDAAAARDIDVVVVVESDGEAAFARVLVGAARGPKLRRASVDTVVVAALATIADDGTLRGAAPPIAPRTDPPPRQRKPIARAWWLWTTLAVVVATGVGLGLGLGLRDRESDRLIIYGPR